MIKYFMNELVLFIVLPIGIGLTLGYVIDKVLKGMKE